MSPESESVVDSTPIVVPVATFSLTDEEDIDIFEGAEFGLYEDIVTSIIDILLTEEMKVFAIVFELVVVGTIQSTPSNKTIFISDSISPFNSLSWYVIFKLPEKFEVAASK
jgi:hypothetical protein